MHHEICNSSYGQKIFFFRNARLYKIYYLERNEHLPIIKIAIVLFVCFFLQICLFLKFCRLISIRRNFFFTKLILIFMLYTCWIVCCVRCAVCSVNVRCACVFVWHCGGVNVYTERSSIQYHTHKNIDT